MTIIKIIISIIEFFVLIFIAGLLTLLAVITKLLELIILIAPPVCLFLLRTNRQLLSYTIVRCGQMTNNILYKISTLSPNETGLHASHNCTIEFPSCHSFNPGICIGTFPASVPYRRVNTEGEYSPDFIQSQEELGLMEVILADLGEKAPYLQCLLRPEYAPYFSTAGTILLGWIVVCWFLNFIWNFLAPLTISILGIIIVCPSTTKWMLKQLGPSAEGLLKEFFDKVQSSLSQG